jgi:membrane associated rhomboid family serine protease
MNMWFFFVITDNCEHAMGHFFYLVTYFVSGIFATMLHAFSTVLIPVWGPILAIIPSLGASGAIFGLMAVYVILYPSNKFYLPTGSTMRKVTASYFIITYLSQNLHMQCILYIVHLVIKRHTLLTWEVLLRVR